MVVQVEWKEFVVAPGASILVDDNRITRQLLPGDDVFPLFLECHSNGPIKSVAVRVEVTGRTVKLLHGGCAVRVKLFFLNDPSEAHLPERTAGGYLIQW